MYTVSPSYAFSNRAITQTAFVQANRLPVENAVTKRLDELQENHFISELCKAGTLSFGVFRAVRHVDITEDFQLWCTHTERVGVCVLGGGGGGGR